ncbi:hypothetical protein GCM10007320_04880 [Pseudorhodoferax aquiterrae]|uniref:DUF2189 domain-containing protein n=1 Tax=Pseudorhodoferax aquiterrae TaxID=747304 RepID=A0ABQ3FW32_9BURK|nr:DUF2189 domain-containing protein [Pseudorhodoferax aquiterrae]GHC70452.1 hypothetical protein GCM10007320_04880 [Pseudorhodoferax aquiterrae]
MPRRTATRALTESQRFAVRTVGTAAPLRWLARGWADLWRCPLPGLLHGLLLTAFGGALALLAHAHFWLLAGAFSGFLLVAPIAATGLYAVSQALERGQTPGLATALQAWRPRDGRLVLFGVLLALAGTGWVVTSAALVTGFAPGAVQRPEDFLRLVAADASWLFELWLALGALLAAPVFASSVVAIPMMLDRRIGVLAAVLTSWRAVLDNPVPMALWAVLLVGLTLVSLLPALVGLVLAAPWLAHASWHAYRDLVD